MKKALATSLLVISFFLSSITFFVDSATADTACNPYDCAGSNAYLKVGRCEYNTSWCGNRDLTPYQPFTCPTGGGPGSCVGWAQGVDGCNGNTPVPTVTNCSCSSGSAYDYQCSGNGGSCGPGGYGSCSGCISGYDCGTPASGYRGCCLITNTPTPTPAEWCGDGTCQGTNGENCSNCETDCGTCSPPPTGNPYCGDGTCNGGETQSTCCTDCGTGSCSGTPSCSLALSPSSITMGITDGPFTITATPSNVQNGNISQVEFTVNNTAVANVNPVFDTSSPYSSQITPAGTGSTTITATAYMGDSTPRCSASASLTVDTSESQAPDCEQFDVTNPTISEGQGAHFIAEITDVGLNLASDGSFESGGMSYWPTAYQLNEWWAVDSQVWPSAGIEGRYYGKISPLLTATDPHAATGWIQAGENLTNKEYTIKLQAKAHSSSESINRIYLQREPYNGDWAGTGDLANILLNTNPSSWTDWENSVTWPNPGNGTNTTRFRVVLRPGSTHGGAWAQPIYYDAIKAYKTSTAGVNPATVNFYYIPTSADPCTGGNWTLIGTGSRIGSTNYYEIIWDTTGVSPQDYVVAVNAADIQGNLMTGNPGNCGTPGFTFRPACNGNQTITACTVSCTEDCGTGVTLAEQPGQVTPAPTVTGMDLNGRKDLTSSSNVTINWTQPSITSPATINGYQVWIFPQGSTPPANGATSCSGCRQLQETNGAADTSITYTPQAARTDEVDIYVRAFNNSCSPTAYGNWSPVRSVDYVAQVSGTIYDTPSTGSGNNCVGNGGGSAVDIAIANPSIFSSIGGTTANPGSSYTLSNIPYAPSASWADYGFNVTLDLLNPDPVNSYFCNCPTAGSPTSCYQTDTASPASGENFYVTAIDLSNGPWWQTAEGNVYGQTGYVNPVPNACDLAPACDANAIVLNASGDSQSAGAPMSGGTVDANGFYTAYNGTDQPVAEGTSHSNLIREDYDLFIRNIDLSSVTTITATVTDFDALPAGTVYEDAEVYYSAASRIFDFSTNQGTVTAGSKKVFFVNGDITITGAEDTQALLVEDGGYAAFIASGNIIIEDSIGNDFSYTSPGSTAPNLDGVFVASGNLIIADDGDGAAPDNMFVGTGTYVGWGGVQLNRSFDNTGYVLDRALNNEYPTNLFEFRPDFNENTPEILRRPNLVWQEVN